MKISKSKKKHKLVNSRPQVGPDALRYMEIPKTKSRCPWRDDLFCHVCDLQECDVYLKGMSEFNKPVRRKQMRNRSKGCNCPQTIYPRIDVCPDCGYIKTDLELMGYKQNK